MVNGEGLVSWVVEAAKDHGVPGVAVGLYAGGREQYVFHGVTSIENPLPVDDETLFQFGSTGKTFTAAAIMVLVGQGKLDLDEPVRTYVPELRLKDETVAQDVTILHLLNHTAGWDGDLFIDTGAGDDAVAKYVEGMAELDQVTPLGATVAYNNASFALAGRVIERVTGSTFEQAIRSLVVVPLGLHHTFFFPNEVMTRRFAVGHNLDVSGALQIARPWSFPRSGAPMGVGMVANAADQIAWARFHLGDGRAPNGDRVLAEELLRSMQRPTVSAEGSNFGDAVGISWMLRRVDDLTIVSHGGSANGQLSLFFMVPERQFALTALTNAKPNGQGFCHELRKWILETRLGVSERDPEPVTLSAAELERYVGTYDNVFASIGITIQGGGLLLRGEMKPEMLATLSEAGQPPPPELSCPLGILPGPGDRYIVTGGQSGGSKGHFVRDAAGDIEAINFGGRLATRVESRLDATR